MSRSYRRDPRTLEREAVAQERMREAQKILKEGMRAVKEPFKDVLPEDMESIRITEGQELEELRVLSSITYASEKARQRKIARWMRDRGWTVEKLEHEDGSEEIVYRDAEGNERQLPEYLVPDRSAIAHRISLNLAEMAAPKNEELIRDVIQQDVFRRYPPVRRPPEDDGED